ncbi:MAG: nuclear transport factor 2 family protein [Sphingomonadaceae bacterium]
MFDPISTVSAYLLSMESADLAAVLECFDEDGLVTSPVYGTMPVEPFYRKLFSDTEYTTLLIHDIYRSISNDNKVIAHFGYKWCKVDGSYIETNLVDIFDLSPESGKIVLLKIVFDKAPSEN